MVLKIDEKITKSIIDIIISIPGLVGLVDKNSDVTIPKKLSATNLSKGIDIQETKKGHTLKAYIVIAFGVRSEIISNEIYQALKFYETQQKFKFSSINIYIRGIR